TVYQLSKDGINPIAHSPQHSTPGAWWSMFGSSKRGQQSHVCLAQDGFEAGQPVIAVAQQQAPGTWRQIEDHLALMDIGGCQFNARDDPRPADTNRQAKPVKGLPDQRILPIARLATKAAAAIGARKLADGKRKAVDDANGRIVGQEGITDGA